MSITSTRAMSALTGGRAGAPGAHGAILPTGDSVTVVPGGVVLVERGPGRDHVRMAVDSVGGRVRVIPEDVRRAVSGGRLDVRLFEVTVSDEGIGTPEPSEGRDDADRWKQIALGGNEDARTDLDAPPPASDIAHPGGEHRLTVDVLDPHGRAATTGECLLLGLDNAERTYLPVHDGRASTTVGAGEYTLVVDVVDDDQWHRLVQASLPVDGDVAVTADARRTRPVRTTLPRNDVRPVMADVGFERRHRGRKVGSTLGSVDLGSLNTAAMGPAVDASEFTCGLATVWTDADPHSLAADGSVSFHLLDTCHGEFFTGFDRTVDEDDLVEVRSDHFAQAPDRCAGKGWYGTAQGYVATSGMMLPLGLPARVVHYLDTGDAAWCGSFGEQAVDAEGRVVYQTAMGSNYRTFSAGEVCHDRWNAGTFGPFFFLPHHGARTTGRMWFGVPLFTDQDDHRSGSVCEASQVALFRDGELVAESSGGQVSVEVEPGPGRYRAEVDAVRGPGFDLSTRVSATWTFDSEPSGTEDTPTALPLWAVRFFPEVDRHNDMERVPVLEVPLTVTAQPEAAVGDLEHVSVEASHDGGSTWVDVPVRGRGTRRVAEIAPGSDRCLALRAHVADSAGNTLTQTIVDALRVRAAGATGNGRLR